MKLAALLLLMPGLVGAQDIIERDASPNGGPITPTSVTATTVTISNLAVGGIVFSSTPANGRLAVDASNLFWDDTNNRLGVGTNTPGTGVEISKTTTQLRLRNSASNIADFLNESDGDLSIYSYDGSNYRNILLGVDGSSKGGNVGVKDTSPDADFEVLSQAAPTGYSLAVSSQNDVTASLFGVTGGGHVVSSGTTPAIVCNAGTPVMAADSNDMSGQFTGGAASANCTLTFANAFTKKPRCWCNDETSILIIQAISTTTTLKCTAAITIGTDVITYGCQAAP